MIHADEGAPWYDEGECGVFPGDEKRITVTRLRCCAGAGDEEAGPMLLRFGPDFWFEDINDGKWAAARVGVDGERQPELANVMHWYLDEEKKDEVCYGTDGKECMSYNLATRQYTYPEAKTDG